MAKLIGETTDEFLRRFQLRRDAADVYVPKCRNSTLGAYPFDHIARYYAINMPFIMEARHDHFGVSVYGMDWISMFSPIERAMWGHIRDHGLVMYPQFPIGPFFADFANPHSKVVIECDGREWHDAKKDLARDIEMRRMGWFVYRVPGCECLRSSFDFGVYESMCDESRQAGMAYAMSNLAGCGDAIPAALRLVVQGGGRFPEDLRATCERILLMHLSTDRKEVLEACKS